MRQRCIVRRSVTQAAELRPSGGMSRSARWEMLEKRLQVASLIGMRRVQDSAPDHRFYFCQVFSGPRMECGGRGVLARGASTGATPCICDESREIEGSDRLQKLALECRCPRALACALIRRDTRCLTDNALDRMRRL